MKLILTFALLMFPAMASAQTIILWKVSNQDSPTLVPPYGGQPSPFPRTAQPDEVSDTIVDPLLEAARLARMKALEKAERIFATRDAFQPDLSPLQVQGRVENAGGEAKVLIANQWIGIGRKLNVRLVMARDAAEALAELRKYDEDAAKTLEDKINIRIQQRPFAELTIVGITATDVVLKSEYGTHRVLIPRLP